MRVACFPVGKHVQFNTCYEHENDTRQTPRTSRTISLVWRSIFTFSPEKKMNVEVRLQSGLTHSSATPPRWV